MRADEWRERHFGTDGYAVFSAWLKPLPRAGTIEAAIIDNAAMQPGGIVRWFQCRDVYVMNSETAAAQERAMRSYRRRGFGGGGCHYHVNLSKIMHRHFVRVRDHSDREIRGLWMLDIELREAALGRIGLPWSYVR